jgi:hypothetical protein
MMNFIKRRYTASRLRKSYKAVFKDDESGQLVLHDILRYCGTFRTPYVQGDSSASHILMGKQDVGLYLLRVLGYKEVDAETLLEDARNYLVSNDIENDDNNEN